MQFRVLPNFSHADRLVCHVCQQPEDTLSKPESRALFGLGHLTALTINGYASECTFPLHLFNHHIRTIKHHTPQAQPHCSRHDRDHVPEMMVRARQPLCLSEGVRHTAGERSPRTCLDMLEALRGDAVINGRHPAPGVPE